MIFLTLGTHNQQFTRAVEAVLPLAGPDEKVVVQGGATPRPRHIGENVEWHQWLSFPDMIAATEAADVVVCQGGVGSIMLALELGRPPVVIARLAAFGEHVDDHQLEIVERMGERGLVLTAESEGGLEQAVAAARNLRHRSNAAPGAELRAAVMAAADGPMRERVAVYGPGSSGKGGMERFTEALVERSPNGFAVMEVDTYGSGGLGMVFRFARAVGRAALLPPPSIAHLNVAERGSVLRKALIASILRRRGVPHVVHVHGSGFAPFERNLPGLLRRQVHSFLDGAVMVVVLGEPSKAHLIDEVGLPESSVSVVANGVSGPASVEPRPQDGVMTKLQYAGRLGDRKGVADLIRALGLLRERDDWILCAAGNGDIERYMELARAVGIGDRVEFTGWADSDEICRRLTAADVFILPSYAEGLPLAVLEAMAHGCAVVTTPVGNITDVVEHRANGLLVQPGDVEALAESIRELLDDAQLRRQLGTAARSTWQRRYSHERMSSELGAIWSASIGSSHSL